MVMLREVVRVGIADMNIVKVADDNPDVGTWIMCRYRVI